MNWYLFLTLTSLGLPIGILSLRGMTNRVEPVLWILMGLFAALVLGRSAVRHGWLLAVAIGLTWGIVNGLLQSVFFDAYAANNARMIAQFSERPAPLPLRYFLPIMGVFVGLATGLVLAAMTFVVRRIAGPIS